jgi:hypothetical protein
MTLYSLPSLLAFPLQQHPHRSPTPTPHKGIPAVQVLVVWTSGVDDFGLGFAWIELVRTSFPHNLIQDTLTCFVDNEAQNIHFPNS